MSSDSSSPAPGTSGAPPKKRNATEKAIVWGGIGLMLIVLLVEMRAKQGYAYSLQSLEKASMEDRILTMTDARALMALKPSISGPVEEEGHDVYTCRWFSFFKGDYYKINLIASYDKKDLMRFHAPSFDLIEDPEPYIPDEETLAMNETGPGMMPDPASMGGMAGMGGGGGGGGGRFPNPVRDALDADGDGTISAAEIEGAAAAFATLDKDSDGALSAEELGSPPADAGSEERPRFPNRLVTTVDENGDGNLSAEELANVVAGLKKLDADGDGAISREERMPPGGMGGGPGGPGGPGGGRGRPEGGRGARPALETESPPAEASSPPETPPAEKPAGEPAAAPASEAPASPAPETPAAAEKTESAPESAPEN